MEADQKAYQDLAFEFLDRVEALYTKEEVYQELDIYARKFGANRIAMVDLDPFLDNDPEDSMYDTWPEEWFEHYYQQQYMKSDPVVLKSLTSLAPFWWREAIEEANVPLNGQRVMDEATEFQMHDGFLIPIHGSQGKTGAITLAGGQIDHHPHAGYAMHMIAMYAYMRIKKIEQLSLGEAPAPHPIKLLTERELECLKWAAAGKTNWEIGEILSISQNTVRNLIERAKEKLNVGRRVEAINIIKGEIRA